MLLAPSHHGNTDAGKRGGYPLCPAVVRPLDTVYNLDLHSHAEIRKLKEIHTAIHPVRKKTVGTDNDLEAKQEALMSAS